MYPRSLAQISGAGAGGSYGWLGAQPSNSMHIVYASWDVEADRD